MSSYSYMLLARDQIARRRRSCWCEGCFHQLGRDTLRSAGYATLVCDECESNKVYETLGVTESERPSTWHEQEAKDLGTGLAGRRVESQVVGHKFATMLRPSGFMAIQARERWSTTENIHLRPGHCWYAQASDRRKPSPSLRIYSLGKLNRSFFGRLSFLSSSSIGPFLGD